MKIHSKKIAGSFLWTAFDIFLNQGFVFIIGIVLARILKPSDFGTLGLTSIFISFSMVFVDGGFSKSLLRNNNSTDVDKSTIFYFNIIIAVFFYCVLFLFANNISSYFKNGDLSLLLKVLGLVIIVDSVSIVQRITLEKEMDFRLIAKINIFSGLISGFLALYLAFNGLGIWSLVIKSLLNSIIVSVLLWWASNWKPITVFNFRALKVYSGFGFSIFLQSILDFLYKNGYQVSLSHFFSSVQLGYLNRAQVFGNYPSNLFTSVITKVTFPYLSSAGGDLSILKHQYRKISASTFFMISFVMVVIASIANPMVTLLIGERWGVIVNFVQLLSLSAAFYPLHSLSLNLLYVLGRSDLTLKLELIKKIIGIPILIYSSSHGLLVLVYALLFLSFIFYLINSYYPRILLNYRRNEQLKDLFPPILLNISIGVTIYMFNFFAPFDLLSLLVFDLLIACFLFITFSELFKLSSYIELKKILFSVVGI